MFSVAYNLNIALPTQEPYFLEYDAKISFSAYIIYKYLKSHYYYYIDVII